MDIINLFIVAAAVSYQENLAITDLTGQRKLTREELFNVDMIDTLLFCEGYDETDFGSFVVVGNWNISRDAAVKHGFMVAV